MKRDLTAGQLAERSISKKYRKEIWNPLIAGVKRYEMIQAGDRIAVCVSGGKDSMLLAKAMQLLHRISETPFSLEFMAMDPGYSPENRRKLEENARLLEIPMTVFETDIFQTVEQTEKNPCYLCARMRRGHLYSRARELGCNKIALGHHFSDVIETTLLSMLYGAQLQGMMPKLHSKNYPGMELIRPLYCVHEDAILAWQRYNQLSFLQCACRFTERGKTGREADGKRQEIKEWIKEQKKNNPDVEKCIFASLHAVCLDTFPGYSHQGVKHSFLDMYDR